MGVGLLSLYALWFLISNYLALLSLSFYGFLAQYVELIDWVKQIAFYVMPHGFDNWLFGAPAVIYFPMPILMRLVIS